MALSTLCISLGSTSHASCPQNQARLLMECAWNVRTHPIGLFFFLLSLQFLGLASAIRGTGAKCQNLVANRNEAPKSCGVVFGGGPLPKILSSSDFIIEGRGGFYKCTPTFQPPNSRSMLHRKGLCLYYSGTASYKVTLNRFSLLLSASILRLG